MSYDIYIGEAECVDIDGQIEVRVREETSPDAPTFLNDGMQREQPAPGVFAMGEVL